MSGKKAKQNRKLAEKTWQHVRRQYRDQWDEQKWNEAVDMLFSMKLSHRVSFAMRLIFKRKIEHQKGEQDGRS